VISGPDAVLGQDWLNAVEVAVNDRDGMLLGHEIEIDAQDGLCTVEGGAQAALAIASDPTVVGIIGSACSDETVGGIQAITEAGLTSISPSATRPALTIPERGPEFAGFLRTAHSDAFQGKGVAEFAVEQGFANVATIHDGSAYAEALVSVFEEEFAALGGTITQSEAVSKGQTDMGPVLTSIAADGPDALYFPIFTAEGGFIVDRFAMSQASRTSPSSDLTACSPRTSWMRPGLMSRACSSLHQPSPSSTRARTSLWSSSTRKTPVSITRSRRSTRMAMTRRT